MNEDRGVRKHGQCSLLTKRGLTMACTFEKKGVESILAWHGNITVQIDPKLSRKFALESNTGIQQERLCFLHKHFAKSLHNAIKYYKPDTYVGVYLR